ncbi:MAG: non-hydrolyzing UDP-N-acetylglucosamine 2-epimerase [Thiobacillaceae bacterium]
MGACEVLCVVGARPNFMKIAPIMAAFAAQPVHARLVHTGQHYDAAMSDSFFEQLGIPRPHVNLEVGSASHAVQTAEIMRAFEPVLDAEAPRAVLVVGDVNSTIACALVAAKKEVPVIHVEAGLRSFDRRMPEEINRVLTDQLSELLFITERGALENLRREGIAPERVHFVGNVMIDTLRRNLPRATPVEQTLGHRPPQGYAVLTLHRPSNVDDPDTLAALLDTVGRIAARLPVIFPIHPRTRAAAERFGLADRLERPGIRLLPPQGYLEMLGLVREATLVLTDSGGLQVETTALGVPCITLRENTERPITLTEGTNTLTGPDPEKILQCFDDILTSGGKRGRIPEYWDGRAAERIATIVRGWLDG